MRYLYKFQIYGSNSEIYRILHNRENLKIPLRVLTEKTTLNTHRLLTLAHRFTGMSCSPDILLFMEDCEKREDEERSYRLRTLGESYPDEVKEKASEIMDKAVWLPDVSEQTRKGGKYKVPGHWSKTGSKHTGFIAWEEDGETYYVCNANKDSPEYGKLLWATDKAPQYPKLTKEKGQMLGKILLNYFAP